MTDFRSYLSVLCSMMMMAAALPGQQQTSVQTSQAPVYERNSFLGAITSHYRDPGIDPIRLANSARLESLLRAGRLYLSLQDAIALAIENNLDVEMQRYGPMISKASLQRALAGGLLRGVPPTIQQGAQSAQSQAIGSSTGGTGNASGATGAGSGAGAGGGGGSTGGTVITATGTAIQNLDPVFVSTMAFGHSTRPQSNTVTTGLTAIAFNSQNFSNAIQKSWLTGTTASLGWNMTGVSSNNPLNDINPSRSGNFQLQVNQRLLQGFGIAVNNRNIRIAKNNVKVSDLQFQLQLITTVSAIQNLYWDLVSFNEDLKVKQQALALAQKLYEDNKKQVEIGTLAPIEIVSAQAQVARRQQELLQSETVLLQQETILKNALSRTGVLSPTIADARIVPMDSIKLPPREAARPLKELYEEAMNTRPDLEQTRINIENSKIGLKGSRSQLLPSLDVTMSVQNNGLAGTGNMLPLPHTGLPVPNRVDPFFVGNYGRVLGQLFRRNFPDYSIGFQLNIPIRNRSALADMTLDTLSLRQAELQQQKQLNQLRVDINNATIALQQARARFDAAAQERILQEQTLDAEQKKYALGASTVFFVIQYQRDLAQAQANEVAALGSYAKAEVDLDRVLGRTLTRNNINIVEAMSGRVSHGPTPLPPEGASK
ncbi:MAG: TolC family protein [Bryobacterales bacterium]|nr:TolC family protein [Bryobacterales bacterium]